LFSFIHFFRQKKRNKTGVTPKPSVGLSLVSSGWKLELLSFQDFGDVEIEEVAVKDGLNASSHDGNDVVESLGVVAPDPVQDVETTVGAESEEIVAGDALSLPGLRHHEQLG